METVVKHKNTEERLRLLESAVVNANDAIIIIEAEPTGLLGRRILYVNEAFTKMTQYTFEEAINKSLRILRGPKTSRAELDKIRKALDRWEPVRVELINYRKDGTEFWVECNIVPVTDDNGRFTHWVSVQRDVTGRKCIEEERDKLMKEIEAINADLTKLNQEIVTIGAERTMSLMALTVADRVRNPAAIIGHKGQRILDKEGVSNNLRKGLEDIIKEAKKLETIVKDFQTLLRSRQSMFGYEDINGVAKSVILAVEKEFVHKGVKIVVTLSEEPLCINMQRDLLRVAIFHVIRNAIEATPEGGRITVSTSGDRDNVVLAVSDTGHGIPEEHIDNIFDSFFSTREHGFGMGLPLVKQIVSEHLGDMKVESELENGMTFKMIFPVRWKER